MKRLLSLTTTIIIFPLSLAVADVGESEAAIEKRYGPDTFPGQHLYEHRGTSILMEFSKGKSVVETYDVKTVAACAPILVRYVAKEGWIVRSSTRHETTWVLPSKGLTARFTPEGCLSFGNGPSLTISLKSYVDSQPTF